MVRRDISTPFTPVEQAILKAWGASPTPVNWPEVYMALEQQVVQGTYVQPMWTTTAKHHEAMKYYTEVGGVQNMHFCVMSMATWDSMNDAQKQAIEEASQEAQAFGFDLAPKLVDGLKAEMEKVGGEFYYPTDEEMQLWMGIKDKIWSDFADQIDQDLVARVQKAQE